MDDDFNESEFNDAVESGNNSSFGSPSLGGFNDFASGLSNATNSDSRKKDINSINDRRKNEEIRKTDEDYGKTHSRQKKQKEEDENSDSITGKSRSKGSDELEGTKTGSSSSKGSDDSSGSKDSSDKKDSKDKKESKEGASAESDSDGESGLKGAIKQKFKKVKIILIIIAVFVGLLIVAFLAVAIMTAIDNLTLGLSSFFGVPEATTEESGDIPGLYTDDQYLFNENGEPMSREELISYLDENSDCNGNIWTNISDKWNSLWDSKIGDVCELIRYVKKEAEDKNVDQALIISTIFYGYDTRPRVEDYINSSDAPEQVETLKHFESLREILQDKNTTIKRSEISKIIDNAHAKADSYYYTWVISEEKDGDGNVTSVTGKCVRKDTIVDKYNLDKWKVYMRFGENAAAKFDEVVLKEKNFEASSDECKDTDGEYTKEQLEKQVSRVAKSYGEGVSAHLDFGSVESARDALEKPDATGSEIFYQAANTETKTKDYFESYQGIEFDYKNGYAYQHFPSFGPSMEPDGEYYGKVKIEYDDIFTPKEVEQLILNIVDRKKNMNNALLREDPDEEEDYVAQLGGYTGVPTGANCQKYLTASLNEIKVKLTDCLGKYLDTVTFEDYIIGVANGEVSNKNDDYVLSEMVAAISYALNRRNNYTKGTTIEMKSGNCDQVYCSMLRGCTMVPTPYGSFTNCHSYYIGGSKKSPELYSKYQALYEIASDYLLIKNDAPFSAHYVNTSQNRWYDKASRGMSFTQIMQEEYQNEGATLVRCSDGDSEPSDPSIPPDDGDRTGGKATAEYPSVAPDLGKFYGFSYKDGSDNTHVTINPEWKDANLATIRPSCDGNSDFAKMSFTVHKNAIKSFQKAFSNICKILTKGVKISSGEVCHYTTNDLLDGTVFIERKTSMGTFDSHAYGIAQDWNYSKKITVNGKTYTPYNTRDLAEYKEFVNAIGGEEKCQNVNYILYSYAYKDAGFNWGGNYGRNGHSGTFDGKLFELKYN